MPEEKKSIISPVAEKLPPPNKRVIVVSKTFRCLGYLDRAGVWRNEAKGEELQEVIGWFEF